MAITWDEVRAAVAPVFERVAQPDRSDLITWALDHDAADAVVDALDCLGSRPLASLESLKEALQKAGQVSP